MSMRDYAVRDFGLVLDKDAMKCVAKKLYMKDCETEDGFDEAFEDDPWGFCEGVESKFNLSSCSNFTGEAKMIDDNGLDDWRDSLFYSDDAIYYLPTKKCSTLFKAAYSSFDEIIAEFKKTIGEYLPEDFDYRNNFRMITGTYFG